MNDFAKSEYLSKEYMKIVTDQYKVKKNTFFMEEYFTGLYNSAKLYFFINKKKAKNIYKSILKELNKISHKNIQLKKIEYRAKKELKLLKNKAK
jgi:hypothetical protein